MVSCEEMMRSVITEKTRDLFPVFEEEDGMMDFLCLCAKCIDMYILDNGGECVNVAVSDNDDMTINVALKLMDYSPASDDDPLLAVFQAAVFAEIVPLSADDMMLIMLEFPGAWVVSALQ